VAPAGTPLVALDAVLLLLTAAVAVLAGRGVRRASGQAVRQPRGVRHASGQAVRQPRGVRRANRWAARGRANVRLLPLLLPLALTFGIHRVVGLLYRGRDVAWVQVLYLYPTFMILLLTATVGGVAVFAARVARRQEEAPCG